MPYTTFTDLNRAHCDEIFSKYYKTYRVSRDWSAALRHRDKLDATISTTVAKRLHQLELKNATRKTLGVSQTTSLHQG